MSRSSKLTPPDQITAADLREPGGSAPVKRAYGSRRQLSSALGSRMKMFLTDERSLRAFGEEASALLLRHDYSTLVNRFGYALAFDRDPAAAVEADYLRSAASPHQSALDERPIKVSYFKPNSIRLFALVECQVPVTQTTFVLLELIVTGSGEEKHITVEHISGVAA